VTTYWIANDGFVLEVFASPPTFVAFEWRGQKGTEFNVPKRHWPAVGLPHEIAPGECWEVRWVSTDENFGALALHSRLRAPEFIPIARNVTQELKEAERG
jgi:hypothetical protein